MDILTLNVWFEKKLRRARTAALLQVVGSLQPMVCCFQEVVPEVAGELVSGLPEWTSSDPGDGSTVKPYGVMIFVRPLIAASFSFHELPTGMCRRLLVAELPRLAVATVHLESLDNHPTREAQLRRCAEVLAPFPNAVLAGDFNFDSERNFVLARKPLENVALKRYLPDFTDLWATLRPTERGFTFDSSVNTYLARPEQMRYDRVLARLSSCRAGAIEMVGHTPVDDLVDLSEKERAWVAQPPTPPRPQARVCRLDEPSWDLDPAGAARAEPVAARGRSETPPRRKQGLFLSDHFGLLARLEC